MAVTILHQEPIQIVFEGVTIDKIKAIMAVPTGAASQWYQWTDSSVPPDTVDVQAYVNARELQYRSEALAANTPAIGQAKLESLIDLWRHWEYREVFDTADFLLRNGMYDAAIPPTIITVPDYRTVLDDVESYLNTELGSTIFDRSYKNDRIAILGATVGVQPASAFTTMTQCVNCHVVLRSWLLDRLVTVERIQSTGILNQ